jgi:hypothetical protein
MPVNTAAQFFFGRRVLTCGLWALDYTASAAVGFEIILVGLTLHSGRWLVAVPLACLHAADTCLAF